MANVRAYRFGGEVDPEGVRKSLTTANPGSLVQVTRDDAADNEDLLEMLAAQTLRAESSGDMLAKKPEIDFLLRLARTTQISKAIESQGAVPGRSFLAINFGREPLSAPVRLRSRELPRKDLTKAELLRVEESALLNARRG